MTKDRPRKKAIRARMAASGEPYSVAARKLDAASPPTGGAPVDEIVACAHNTLAEQSARIALRSDLEVTWAKPRATPGRVERLARLVGKAVWGRISGGADFRHLAGEGFLEPAAGRYMIDFGSYAQICADGVTFGGLSGRSLQTFRRSSKQEGDVLWLLRLLPGTTEARLHGNETLRRTLCRRYDVRVEVSRAVAAGRLAGLQPPSGVDPTQPPVLGLTVWIDGTHIRQIRFEDRAPKDPQLDEGASAAKVLTLELWDFGTVVQELDWSRLPTFRTPPQAQPLDE